VCATFEGSQTKTFDDALKRETVMGGDAPGGSLFDYLQFLRREVGAKFKVVRGYKGSVDILLSMERREVEGICGLDWSSLRTQKPDWVRDKKMHVILQTGLDTHAGLTKMGVPEIWKYVKNEDSRRVLELILGQQVFGRPFMLPPGAPADRLAILRKAFEATMADKAFVADAEKMGLEITPANGARVQEGVTTPRRLASRRARGAAFSDYRSTCGPARPVVPQRIVRERCAPRPLRLLIGAGAFALLEGPHRREGRAARPPAAG
jgi:hypothetical protein